ncbi:MAG: hypothetical protein ACRESZ_05660 [Methylococcales bacterium]
MLANLRMLGATAVFLGYPYLVYRGMAYGFVWIAPLLVSFLYIYRALGNWHSEDRLVNLLVGVTLIFGVIFLKSVSAKFLPVLIQMMFCWFFGRTLFRGPPLVERFVRVDFPVFPPGIAEYCRQLTWIWTLFFAVNVPVCSAFALWADDGWWAFYTGVMIIVLTGLLLAGEYIYRHYRFPDIQIPDPATSFRSILVNSRKIWMDLHAR